ncbi:MAG: PAS domain S-box protein [Candidatus Brocadiia bacterium]|nr:MAG: PAS domain S-box protein [Candidatus Brocadiia bacterium]
MTRKNKSNENPVNEPKPADHDITELMHAYELLQESQERYRLFIDAMGEGFAVQDGTNCLSYVNSKFCRMLGYSREELLGKETSRVIDASSLEPTFRTS